ncbi:acyltransferase [bacterium]|nr:acyltransferase [bacterium]
MKAAVLQFSPHFGDTDANLARMEEMLDGVEADLAVLPELCISGYQFLSRDEAASLSEPIPDGPAVERMTALARKRNMYICWGMAEKAGDTLYNASVLTGPEGYIGVYRKTHLFLDEKKWFAPGDLGFPVWRLGEVRAGMMICFDWIYPEAARSLALQGADIILHPVNLVLPWCQQAMLTRSLENRVFSITANRVGSEQRGDASELVFTGASQIVDPSGGILFRMGRDTEGVQTVEFDPLISRNKRITVGNSLFEDRKPDRYTLR